MASPESKIKISLTGPPETLLGTLVSRSHDAANPNSILGDKWATETVNRIDYDFSKMGVDVNQAAGIAMRGYLFDLWTREFLKENQSATVLHIACGLDARCNRVTHGSEIRWIDVDMPEVVQLRRQVTNEPEGDYRLLGASAATPGKWLRSIPNDRPTLIIFEGLSMYLSEDEFRSFLQALLERFAAKGGQLVFDHLGTISITAQKWMKMAEVTGSELKFGTDDPSIFKKWLPELILKDDIRNWVLFNHPSMPTAYMSLPVKTTMWVFSMVPWFRDYSRSLRYRF
ncbi:hypothetical protein S40293_10326 [Stachybotrys chartarum IBT 40293]|nr:hypothetical protein S40293_10326 [Stachybotrys chartarum IBT 40293]